MWDMPMLQQSRFYKLAIIVLLFGYSAGCLSPTADSKSGIATTVILIRHAERDNFFTLTHKGHERSKVLMDAVGGIVKSKFEE